MKNETDRPHDMIFDAVDIVSSIAFSLEDLAWALHRSGNHSVGQELEENVKGLRHASTIAKRGAGLMIDASHRDAVNGTMSIVAAALAGINIAEKNKKQ
jgi:hypothetical protein